MQPVSWPDNELLRETSQIAAYNGFPAGFLLESCTNAKGLVDNLREDSVELKADDMLQSRSSRKMAPPSECGHTIKKARSSPPFPTSPPTFPHSVNCSHNGCVQLPKDW